jgi:hypothetical protein
MKAIRYSEQWLADYNRRHGGIAPATTDERCVLVREVKPLKYRNEPTGNYASKLEAARAAELQLLERAGTISELREQVRYILIPAQYDANRTLLERACIYIADFTYRRDGRLVVEDTKGCKTPDYIIKRKLMLYVHGIKVDEIIHKR